MTRPITPGRVQVAAELQDFLTLSDGEVDQLDLPIARRELLKELIKENAQKQKTKAE